MLYINISTHISKEYRFKIPFFYFVYAQIKKHKIIFFKKPNSQRQLHLVNIFLVNELE